MRRDDEARQQSSTDDGEKGAALVEFALLATLLFMLIFGTITAGISFSRSNALQTAAREGARFAATLTGGGSDQWFIDVIHTTQGAALGELEDGIPGRQICVAFIESGSTGNTVTVTSESTPLVIGDFTPSPTSSCFTDGLSDGPRVQVQVIRETQIQAVMFATDINVSGEAVARYER